MTGKAILLLFLASFQVTLLTKFSVDGVAPDLILITIILWAPYLNLTENLILTFIGGMFIDLFSFLPSGTTALALISIVYLVEYWKTSFSRVGMFLLVLAVWLATIIKSLGFYIVSTQVGYSIQLSQLLHQVFIALIYNSILLIFFLSFKAINRWRQLVSSNRVNI